MSKRYAFKSTLRDGTGKCVEIRLPKGVTRKELLRLLNANKTGDIDAILKEVERIEQKSTQLAEISESPANES